MTEKDKSLIDEAFSIRCNDMYNFGAVAELVNRAESQEAKRTLHGMAVAMYHAEEAAAGLL